MQEKLYICCLFLGVHRWIFFDVSTVWFFNFFWRKFLYKSVFDMSRVVYHTPLYTTYLYFNRGGNIIHVWHGSKNLMFSIVMPLFVSNDPIWRRKRLLGLPLISWSNYLVGWKTDNFQKCALHPQQIHTICCSFHYSLSCQYYQGLEKKIFFLWNQSAFFKFVLTYPLALW